MEISNICPEITGGKSSTSSCAFIYNLGGLFFFGMDRKPCSSSSASSFEELNARLDTALAEQQKQQEKQRRTQKRQLLDATNKEGSKPASYGTINDIQSSSSKQNYAEVRREIVKASIEEQCQQHDTKTRNKRVKRPSDIMQERVARSWGSPASPPEYDEDSTNLTTKIQELKRLFEEESGTLPIRDAAVELEGSSIGWDILSSYFSALENKGDELVALFIEKGLVMADTKDGHGTTPLLAAIKAGNMKMCQELLDFGANIDEFGILPHGGSKGLARYWCQCQKPENSPRTPLMFAAETGNLTLVKLFMEVYDANDALIATDGQVALRLAAINGHREIVNFLPVQRGGGWRRWKKEHSKAMCRVRKAGESILRFGRAVIWDVPILFLYRIPKWMVVFLWEEKNKIPGWIARFVRWLPEAGWGVLKWLGRIVKGVPKAAVVVAKFLWRMLQAIGRSIAHIGKATFSFLHSLMTAVITFFRSLTLRDLCNRLMEIFKLPLRLWDLLEDVAKSTLKFMKALFGFVGEAVTWLSYGIIWVINYAPRKMWEIVASIGGLFAKTFKELAVLVNPRVAF
jgi:hypothetical protein